MLAGGCILVNFSAVCDAIGVLPWRSIWSADNLFERLSVHLSLLVERFVLTKVISVHNKDNGLIMTSGLHSTSSRGPISGGLVIALEFTSMSLSIARGGPMLYMPRLCVSLVSEAGIERPVTLVVVYPEVGCVRLRFGFVSCSSYWGG